MSNISDRGGANRWDAKHVFVDDEAPDAIRDHRLDDVRSLSSEDISELGERYGTLRIAGEIAARAMAQLQSVRLVVDRSPSGQRQLYRDGEAPELTEQDKRAIRSRELGLVVNHFHNARHTVLALLVDIVGEERAPALWETLEGEPLRRVLAVPKRERRKALARELESIREA